MKRNILITGSALTIVLAVFGNKVFSQPNNYPHRYPQQQRDYPQAPPIRDYGQGPSNRGYGNQWQQPAAPFIIIDADGRRSGYNGRNFDQCFEQRSLSRKQRRKLEKRYGFIPPLVIYVPDRYVTRTPRGEFYMYTNGLMYQKQRDGYFHLDDRYFNDDRDDWNDRNNWNDNRGRWDNNRNGF